MRVVGVLGTGKPFIQDETDPGGGGGGVGGGMLEQLGNKILIKYSPDYINLLHRNCDFRRNPW
jgi:hypothetical protein